MIALLCIGLLLASLLLIECATRRTDPPNPFEARIERIADENAGILLGTLALIAAFAAGAIVG